ncbi:MAG: ATP-binding protein, partial [Myxococcales bacterium]
CTGALLLASDLPEIGEEDLLAFGRAIGAYINQALSLAAAFQRVEAATEAQRELFSCVDVDDTLRAIARLGTQLGDLCQVDVIRDGAVVQTEKAHRHPDRLASRLEHELTVPLEAHGMQLAMMRLFRRAAPYGRVDRQAAEQLARTASVALHKAHLYRETRTANQAKDDFLATMSHELRTPLTAVLLWTDKLLRRTSDPAVIAHGLTVIHDNAKLQANLIDDILDVSRVVTGKLVVKMEQVDLEAIVAAAVQIITPSADARAIAIETSFDPGTSMIAGDPQRLQQVVLNLLSNAVKFTAPGGRITITVSRASSCIELRVRDSGKGIDPAFLPFVFDPFRQADLSSNRAHGGLGLGLALVKSLVELHGGKARAESAGFDKGATFVVRLPVPAVRDYGLRKPGGDTRDQAPLRPDRERLKGLRLLVVDDESEVRELIADLLAEFGAQVRTVASVKDAMRAFAEFKPNLLITDLGMPVDDGYELIRQVRLTSAVPAVALTAYVGEEDQRRVLASGFQMHLRKPVRPEVLLEAITGLAAGLPRQTFNEADPSACV